MFQNLSNLARIKVTPFGEGVNRLSLYFNYLKEIYPLTLPILHPQ